MSSRATACGSRCSRDSTASAYRRCTRSRRGGARRWLRAPSCARSGTRLPRARRLSPARADRGGRAGRRSAAGIRAPAPAERRLSRLPEPVRAAEHGRAADAAACGSNATARGRRPSSARRRAGRRGVGARRADAKPRARRSRAARPSRRPSTCGGPCRSGPRAPRGPADAVARQRAGAAGRPGGAGRARGRRSSWPRARPSGSRSSWPRADPLLDVGPRRAMRAAAARRSRRRGAPTPSARWRSRAGRPDPRAGRERGRRSRSPGCAPRCRSSTARRRRGATQLGHSHCSMWSATVPPRRRSGSRARALANEASVDEDARAGRPQYVARVALALAGEPAEALVGLERALGFSSARGSIMGQGIGLAGAP